MCRRRRTRVNVRLCFSSQTLFQAGEAKWGTDESEFNRVMCSRSYPHLRAVFAEYQGLSKKTLEQAIKSEFSGYIEKGMLAVGE